MDHNRLDQFSCAYSRVTDLVAEVLRGIDGMKQLMGPNLPAPLVDQAAHLDTIRNEFCKVSARLSLTVGRIQGISTCQNTNRKEDNNG